MRPERRARTVALLTHIDQQAAEARSTTHNELLSAEERKQAAAWLAFYQSAVRHTEILLRKV